MRRLLLTILIFMSASIALHARYGETLEQLETRFGKGSKAVLTPNDKNIFDAINGFKKNDVNITAYMIDGKCERITYNNAKGFTEEEISNLLEANKLNSSWTPTSWIHMLVVKLARAVSFRYPVSAPLCVFILLRRLSPALRTQLRNTSQNRLRSSQMTGSSFQMKWPLRIRIERIIVGAEARDVLP